LKIGVVVNPRQVVGATSNLKSALLDLK